MAFEILIVGAGVAGPALASLLLRTRRGYNITIIERSPDLRVTGQQIDIEAHSVTLLRSMGLMELVKQHCVSETGLECVNTYGKRLILMGVSPADKRGFTLTNEHEIMRGDLVQILYDDSLQQLKAAGQGAGDSPHLCYKFDTTIKTLVQSDDGAQVTFSNGESKKFDLVVAADGQRSKTRSMAFGAEADGAFHSLGLNAAYCSIPRLEGEGGLAKMCFVPGGWLAIRPSNRPVTGALFFTVNDEDRIRESYKRSAQDQKQLWSEMLAGCTWQEQRLRTGLLESEDFFAHEHGQVKMSRLSTGRVVLLGDAGYCPSPFTGLGTNLALQGALVLAGELAQHQDDVAAACHAYEVNMRPLITESQRLLLGGPKMMMPTSPMSSWFFQLSLRAISLLQIDKLLNRWMSSSESGLSAWKAPVYPELNLAP